MSRAETMAWRLAEAMATEVVDYAVDDHAGDILRHGNLVGGDAGDFPGELIVSLEVRLRWVDLDVM
jgi:hypothetical protein